jgi:sulfopyruvate decarboxylase subunit alpha/phosphonopyruvate decarboxylase
MTAVTTAKSLPETLAGGLRECGFAPFFGTPCGILAPLYRELSDHAGMMTIAREDNAVGIAAGSALSGASPVVLMQNSGLGQSVNAIASLVSPYRIPMLFVIGMRGTEQDSTEENQVMGRATEVVLSSAGIPVVYLDSDEPAAQLAWSRGLVVENRRAAALLVRPTLFGWRP